MLPEQVTSKLAPIGITPQKINGMLRARRAFSLEVFAHHPVDPPPPRMHARDIHAPTNTHTTHSRAHTGLLSNAITKVNVTTYVERALFPAASSRRRGLSIGGLEVTDCLSLNKLAACANTLIARELDAFNSGSSHVRINTVEFAADYNSDSNVACLGAKLDLSVNVASAIGDLITSVCESFPLSPLFARVRSVVTSQPFTAQFTTP